MGRELWPYDQSGDFFWTCLHNYAFLESVREPGTRMTILRSWFNNVVYANAQAAAENRPPMSCKVSEDYGKSNVGKMNGWSEPGDGQGQCWPDPGKPPEPVGMAGLGEGRKAPSPRISRAARGESSLS